MLWGFRKRKDEEAKGVLDISDGQRASICRIGSKVSLDDHLCLSWSNFVHDIALKRYVFLLKNSTFHKIRPLLLGGPNLVKIVSHFINITFSLKKRQGPNK